MSRKNIFECLLLVCVCVRVQASHSVQSDEEFAFELQREEMALLDDSHIAQSLQVILKCMWLFSHPSCKHARLESPVRGCPVMGLTDTIFGFSKIFGKGFCSCTEFKWF